MHCFTACMLEAMTLWYAILSPLNAMQLPDPPIGKHHCGMQEVFVVQPPLNMMSSCIKDGKLSIRLMKVRTSPLAPPCNVQVHCTFICVLTCITAVSPIIYASVTTLSKTASVCVCVCVCVLV